MSTTTPVRLGLIGFGIMGERLLRAALAHDPAVIVPAAVFDPSPEAARRLAEIAPGVPMLGSAEAVIAATDVTYIATPPRLHLPLADAAFAAGKAVFLEKPLAVDLEQASAFVARAEAAGHRAAVNFPMASSPAVRQLAAWREAGAVGTPRALEIEVGFATWPRGWQHAASGWLARREEGGFTREVVSHFLFLTRRMLGELALGTASVTWAGEGLAEQAMTATLTAGGLPVTLKGMVGQTEREDENRWALTGEAGAIRLSNWSLAEKLEAGGWATAPDALPQEKMRPMVLRDQLTKLAALARGDGNQGLATLREALEVQAVVEAILAKG
ncbi:Gfo/Idh/MocA family oxidoreductase [Acetobacteraceae bacterium H6797]|nr:Gfo/Idh/MocA family oxidoreductase [Acetobacteraceae bacterium H6797]